MSRLIKVGAFALVTAFVVAQAQPADAAERFARTHRIADAYQHPGAHPNALGDARSVEQRRKRRVHPATEWK